MEMQPFPLQPLSTHTAHLQCVAEVQQAGLALLQLAGMQPNSMQLVCNPLIVRRAGRKTLYMAGGVQMFTAQVATAVLMGVAFTGGAPSIGAIAALEVFVCVFTIGFAYSHGPLDWLVRLLRLNARVAHHRESQCAFLCACPARRQREACAMCSVQFCMQGQANGRDTHAHGLPWAGANGDPHDRDPLRRPVRDGVLQLPRELLNRASLPEHHLQAAGEGAAYHTLMLLRTPGSLACVHPHRRCMHSHTCPPCPLATEDVDCTSSRRCMQSALLTAKIACLTMRGALQFATFLFFAACVALMTIAIAVLLPETKGVPIEEVDLLWERHFLWRRVVKPAQKDALADENA